MQKKIYPEFVEKSAQLAKERKLGDPLHPETQQGPQVSQEQFDRILGYIESGKKEGARLATGGQRVGKKGTRNNLLYILRLLEK